jgi:Ribbon-helix-helix protein, copG family
MDPRSLEDLLRDDAYLPPFRGAGVMPETVQFAAKELGEIDLWAKRSGIKSRSEAIRRLVERGLKA